ncbi:hypothetical protein GGR58DRAFT_521151 [Xylaria digitata]|nr:hypothetical protein GGR58DRAFT_521151 [Xylaria digitata]
MSSPAENEEVSCPFQKGDQFELPVPATQPSVNDNALEEFRRLLTEWRGMKNSSPPRGPAECPMGTVEPCFYHAIRLDRTTFVAYLLDSGVKMSRLAAWEASRHRCSSTMWQVFVDHGNFDISTPMEDFSLPSLGFVLDNEALIEWFLAQGAEPNAESLFGLTQSLTPVDEGSGVTPESRLEVLQYLLDAGADPNAKKWAHNSKGYASDFDWGSGLNAALANDRPELAEELLRRGARTDVPTFNIASQGETALELAGRYMPALLPLVEACRAREQAQ